MSDDHRFDVEDGDDPLARIRARFEQASERILSGSDDLDLPLPGEAPDVEPSSTVSTIPIEDPIGDAASSLAGNSADLTATRLDPLDDFGEIDIQSDARFSLDFEHGVSAATDLPLTHPEQPDPSIDLLANLAIVRSEAPERSAPVVDDDRHAKHRTRGRVESPPPRPKPAPEEPSDEIALTGDTAPVTEPAPQDKKSKKDRDPVSDDQDAADSSADGAPGSRSGLKLALVAIVLVAAGGVAAFFLLAPEMTGSTPTTTLPPASATTAVPVTPAEEAATALDAFGFVGLEVSVDEEGVAFLTGSVKTARERDLAIETVLGVEGVTDVTTDIIYDINRDPGAVLADVDAIALTINHPVEFVTANGIVTVSGIVPQSSVDAGEMGPGGTLENRLIAVVGVEEVRFDLTLRGDPARLTNKLVNTLTNTPILYDLETGLRPPESDATLDKVAKLMADEPGLSIRIAVRGDDAEETLALAEERRDEIVAYLVDAGVDASLLRTALVASLNPTTSAIESDVLIEVATT